MEWLPILEYRGFYDVPRLLLVAARDGYLLLDCPFDDSSDAYPADYAVYQLATDPRMSLGRDWRLLSDTGRFLGRVPVASITFDQTRRHAIEAGALSAFLG